MEHNHHSRELYTCPMHPEVIQDKPGNCPKCGMNLVLDNGKDEKHSHNLDEEKKVARYPVNEHHTATTEEKQSLQSFQKYTCPMHPQIIQDSPGNCPLCGMTLVPLTKPGTHGGHETHSAGIADFKKRFYVVLILTIPIMLLSEMISALAQYSFQLSRLRICAAYSVINCFLLWRLAISKRIGWGNES